MRTRPTLQELLSRQKAIIGLLQTHPNPVLVEMAGMCGYDFLLTDDEHGVFTAMDHLHALRAIGSSDMLSFVRLGGHDVQAVGRYLDMGVDGIVVPNVSTAEQARLLVRAMEYPPSGTRGFGAAAHRATNYGMSLAAHLKRPRGTTSFIVQIESASGVANVEEILSVDGVAGVIVGPSDLSADLGCAGDFAQPIYTEALTRVERAAAAHNMILGTGPHPGHPIDALIARGHRLLIIGADTPLIRDAMISQVTKAKSHF